MAALIIGGAGFVGLNIAEQLARTGIPAIIGDIQPMPPRAQQGFREAELPVSERRLDILDSAAVADAIRDAAVSVVIHAAAMTADAERERRSSARIVEINLGGLASVLDGLAARPDVPLVHVGSSSVFGRVGAGVRRIGVDHPHRPTSLYGITKSASEAIVGRWADLHRRKAAIIRLGWVFGPWERDTGYRDLLSTPFRLALAARSRASISLRRDARLDWLYAPDAGRAIARVAERLRANPTAGASTWNIGPGEAFPLSAWCARLERAYPGFSWRIAQEEAPTIVILTDTDDPLLDADDFGAAFEGMEWRRGEAAMSAYLTWLADEP